MTTYRPTALPPFFPSQSSACSLEQFLRRGAVGSLLGAADPRPQGDRSTVARLERMLTERRRELGGDALCAFARRAAEDDCECTSAVARHRVARADRRAHDRGGVRDHPVTRCIAMPLVDRAEVHQLDEHDRHFLVLTPGT